MHQPSAGLGPNGVYLGEDVEAFEKDKGEPGKTADRTNECARWLAEYLWAKGVGVEVGFGPLIDAAGFAGYAGELKPETNRWSNRNLLGRAIQAINEKAQPRPIAPRGIPSAPAAAPPAPAPIASPPPAGAHP